MLVEVKGLKRTFSGGGREVVAVDSVDFTMTEGDFVHIIGRSGSGKTTFLNLLAGLLSPTAGVISVCGVDYNTVKKEELARQRNANIGYIPQRAVLLETLNSMENVLLPWYLQKRDGDAQGRARYLLQQLGVEDLAKAYPAELSGGEMRRIQIARALMNEPQILIADEPTSDLDVETTTDLMQLFGKLNDEGLALLVVTHEIDTLSYGKAVYTMQAGQLMSGRVIGEKA